MMAVERSVLQKLCADYWWLALLRGVVVLILGIMMMRQPQMTVVVLIQFMGAYWLVDGLVTIANSIRGRAAVADWGWGLFVGMLSVIAGIVVFSGPLAAAMLTTTFVMYFIAIAALVSGVSSIITGLRLRKVVRNEWSMILSGLLYVGFALLLLGRPLVSAASLVWLLGIFATVGGIMLIFVSFRIRSFGRQLSG
jgi:uncharacterized membrane protein HdeD (DUF308 family)